jgi:hypothetical protein
MQTDIPELEAMRLGVNYRQPIVVRNFKCLMRPLTIAETRTITEEVTVELNSLSLDQRNPLTENTQIAKKTLQLASTSDVGATDYKLTDYIMERMTPEEIEYLFKQYSAVTARCNPSLELLSEADMLRLVEIVKKKEVALIDLSFLQLLSIAHYFTTKDD